MTYLNVKQVAERLAVSEAFVQDELRRHRMVGSKLPNRAGWRVSETDLERYIDAHLNVPRVRRRK